MTRLQAGSSRARSNVENEVEEIYANPRGAGESYAGEFDLNLNDPNFKAWADKEGMNTAERQKLANRMYTLKHRRRGWTQLQEPTIIQTPLLQ